MNYYSTPATSFVEFVSNINLSQIMEKVETAVYSGLDYLIYGNPIVDLIESDFSQGIINELARIYAYLKVVGGLIFTFMLLIYGIGQSTFYAGKEFRSLVDSTWQEVQDEKLSKVQAPIIGSIIGQYQENSVSLYTEVTEVEPVEITSQPIDWDLWKSERGTLCSTAFKTAVIGYTFYTDNNTTWGVLTDTYEVLLSNMVADTANTPLSSIATFENGGKAIA